MSEQPLNIYEKIAKIGEPIQILKKTKKGYNYTYVPEEEILAGIQNGMRKYKVSLIPHIVPNSTKTQMVTTEKTRAAKDGRIYTEYVNEYLVTGEMTFSWVNTENPEERVEVPWYFSGQQPDSSQAYGSALTYASRYFKLQFFQVATTDDPDALLAKKKEREAQENKAVLTEIFSQTAKVIDDYLKSFKDGSKEHTAARQGQFRYLIGLGVRVVFALDEEIDVAKDKNIQRLKRYCRTEYVYNDPKNPLLSPKMSPVDKGKEVWNALYERRKTLL